MRLTRLIEIAPAVLGLSLAAPAAHAVTFTFSGLGSTIGAGSADCSPPYSPGDFCGSSLSWTSGSLTLTATTVGASKRVIQDRNPSNGGLGVGKNRARTNDKDEINPGDTVILTFNMPVLLDGATFHDEDHGSLGWHKSFLFAIDGGAFAPHLFSEPFGDLGTSFSFKYGGSHAEDFYVSTVTVEPMTPPEPVPEPGTLLLMGGGLSALWARRRRSRA